MKIIETVVYEFDELSDKAKEKAREWYRDGALDYEWWESTYEDAERIGLKITGFELDRLAEGHFMGDFMTGPLQTVEKIIEEHGPDCETTKTARRYEPVLRAGILASIDEYENTAHEFLVDLLEDYRVMLQKEMEYQLSDEVVDETIRANEYTFTETGKRF